MTQPNAFADHVSRFPSLRRFGCAKNVSPNLLGRIPQATSICTAIWGKIFFLYFLSDTMITSHEYHVVSNHQPQDCLVNNLVMLKQRIHQSPAHKAPCEWRISLTKTSNHDDVIKWKHFPRYWSFAWGIDRTAPVNYPHKGPATRSFDVFFDLRLTDGWVNNLNVGDLRPHCAQCNVSIQSWSSSMDTHNA